MIILFFDSLTWIEKSSAHQTTETPCDPMELKCDWEAGGNIGHQGPVLLFTGVICEQAGLEFVPHEVRPLDAKIASKQPWCFSVACSSLGGINQCYV